MLVRYLIPNVYTIPASEFMKSGFCPKLDGMIPLEQLPFAFIKFQICFGMCQGTKVLTLSDPASIVLGWNLKDVSQKYRQIENETRVLQNNPCKV